MVTGISASIQFTTISGIIVSFLNRECLDATLNIHAVNTPVTTDVSIPPVPILSVRNAMVPASPSKVGSATIMNNATLVRHAEIFNLLFPAFSITLSGSKTARKMAISPKENVFSMEISGSQFSTAKRFSTPTIEATEPIIIIGRMLMIDC